MKTKPHNDWSVQSSSSSTNKKKLPTANFSFGDSLSLLSIFSFSWFFLPVESFLNSIFLLPSLSFSCTSFYGNSFTNTTHTYYRKRQHPDLCSFKIQTHFFPTFRRIHASLFVFNFLLFLFSSVLCSTSFIVTGHIYLEPISTIAHAQCIYIWLYASYLWFFFFFFSFFFIVVVFEILMLVCMYA